MVFADRVCDPPLLPRAGGRPACPSSGGQVVASPVPRSELASVVVWRLEQFGPVTLMQSFALRSQACLSVNKYNRRWFPLPSGISWATISIREDFKMQECEFIDIAVRKGKKPQPLNYQHLWLLSADTKPQKTLCWQCRSLCPPNN